MNFDTCDHVTTTQSEYGAVALQADPEPPGKPKNTGVGSLSLLRGIFPTRVSRIAGGFFTS